jgi:hypothetical protein
MAVSLGLAGQAGAPVARGTICLPRIGAWHADLETAGGSALAGRVELKIDRGPVLVGTVVRGEVTNGVWRGRVVAGAGGLSQTATPRHFDRPMLRDVLAAAAGDGGEALSATSDDAVLALRLPRWTTIAAPVGQVLRAAIEARGPAGVAWRHLPDGTIWVGVETWPEAPVTNPRELARSPEDRTLDLGLDAAWLAPGSTILGLRVDYVEIAIDAKGARVRAWWTT